MKCFWLLSLSLFILTACGPAVKPIRGEWVMDGNPVPIKMQFNDNGTYLVTYARDNLEVKQHGEYNQNGTWLHMYVKRFEANDKGLQSQYDDARLEAQHMRAKWQGEDVILLDSGKGTRAMRRVKSTK